MRCGPFSSTDAHAAWAKSMASCDDPIPFAMMRRAFDALGYRRYEWKCDSYNVISRRAAERLQLRDEGIFPQVMAVKGRDRNTAWFSIIDKEWPGVRAVLEQRLDPSNFDVAGRQR